MQSLLCAIRTEFFFFLECVKRWTIYIFDKFLLHIFEQECLNDILFQLDGAPQDFRNKICASSLIG